MNLNKVIMVFIVILVLFVGIVYFQIVTNSAPKSKVTINTHTFSVKVATTSAQQQQGLSGVKQLPQDQGMLFVFNSAQKYAFWMKEMKFPLDLVFIKDDKIVTIVENAPLPKNANDTLPIYQPDAPADKVLEINAGLAKKYDFKKNDAVKIVIAK